MPRRWTNTALLPDPDEQACAVCNFRGIPLDFVPAHDTEVTFLRSASAGGKSVSVVAMPGHCPHCGTNRPIDGSRGDL